MAEHCRFYNIEEDRCIIDRKLRETRSCLDNEAYCQIKESFTKHSPEISRRILENKLRVMMFVRNKI